MENAWFISVNMITPISSITEAIHFITVSFSFKNSLANSAVIIGTVDMTTLLVDDETVSQPLLNTIMYMKNPIAPDNANHFISLFLGKLIFAIIAMTINADDAKMYLKNPNEYAE